MPVSGSHCVCTSYAPSFPFFAKCFPPSCFNQCFIFSIFMYPNKSTEKKGTCRLYLINFKLQVPIWSVPENAPLKKGVHRKRAIAFHLLFSIGARFFWVPFLIHAKKERPARAGELGTRAYNAFGILIPIEYRNGYFWIRKEKICCF